jgi:hypothetical protein
MTQTVAVEGAFNIHGVDHPLKLEIQVKLDGSRATADDPFPRPLCGMGYEGPEQLLCCASAKTSMSMCGAWDGRRTGRRNEPEMRPKIEARMNRLQKEFWMKSKAWGSTDSSAHCSLV